MLSAGFQGLTFLHLGLGVLGSQYVRGEGFVQIEGKLQQISEEATHASYEIRT